MDHLRAIDERVASLQEEVRRLEAARLVIVELERRAAREDDKAAKAAKAAPVPAKKPEGSAPNGTAGHGASGKPAASETATPRATKAPKRFVAADIKAKMLAILAKAKGPLPSGDIITALGMDGTKQPVYAALHTMSKSGALVRDGEGNYQLPPQSS